MCIIGDLLSECKDRRNITLFYIQARIIYYILLSG